MRSTALVLAFSLCLAACSKDAKTQLQGKWAGQGVKNVAEDQQPEAAAWAKGVHFEFRQNKLTVGLGTDDPRSGDFDVEDAKGDSVTIRVAREGGGTDAATFTVVDNDKLHWQIGDGRVVVLSRMD
jgi:hypothetical protein